MAPSAAKLKEALIEGTREVYQAEPDGTSVNKVRRLVEEKLGLEDGFFTSEAWKQKSKTIIKEQVVSLTDKLLLPWSFVSDPTNAVFARTNCSRRTLLNLIRSQTPKLVSSGNRPKSSLPNRSDERKHREAQRRRKSRTMMRTRPKIQRPRSRSLRLVAR